MEDILNRIREARIRGDVAAFQAAAVEFYERGKDAALIFARRYGLSQEDAEDCVQKAVLRALVALPTWRPTASFKTWFYTILRRVIIDHFRKTKPWRAAVSLDATDLSDEVLLQLDTSDDASEELLMQEDVQSLRQGLELLDPKWTIYLVLRYFEEMSVEEIALVLEETSTVVKGRLQWARRHLRLIVSTLRKLAEIEWSMQLQVLRDLSHDHTKAWELFFRNSMSVKQVAAALRRGRQEIILLLREAFALLRSAFNPNEQP